MLLQTICRAGPLKKAQDTYTTQRDPRLLHPPKFRSKHDLVLFILFASSTMPPFYEIAVALFGQPVSPVKQWAIIVIFTPSLGHAMVYQITGSASDYSLKAPESVTLKAGEGGYLGKVPVGRVDQERLHQFSATLANVNIVQNDAAWDCQNWVMEGLVALRKDGHHIENVSRSWLVERLGSS
ncbi:hypothetical protein SERLA73DRAFT_179011 [Serpula lacrymans var. lacrymans S7.3]|uniref:Uncharacterized protein n=2 Tax=Serpula lacrymans var. lacrymans TaxID=341189 RepID=F8PTG5_SERL3|nr:uncharacterized protein SERLADRAFT_463861 [Serpula lacrymans var. lacrymans S7.9]EGO00993.1 hypothetical protein SERLA73DRAFT_179011 [Serpula lacrymans var. lacrymans S7.3]EGO26627.1 hypothetical protein SERLADRAFT_463861 [Serpula lacrymans var. lacrymans S7.9]